MDNFLSQVSPREARPGRVGGKGTVAAGSIDLTVKELYLDKGSGPERPL